MQPLHNAVLLEILPDNEVKSQSLIVTPNKNIFSRGKIFKVGEGVLVPSENRISNFLDSDDIVLFFNKTDYTVIKKDGKKYLLVSAENILGIE